jgi:hypothetical protein
MPINNNVSASDYTSFLKAQAASQAYRANKVPTTIQTSAQPFATQSVLNTTLLASKVAYLVTPNNAAIAGNASIRPYNGKGYVNNPKNLSTIHNSTSTTMGSSIYPGGGLPLGRGNPTNVGTMRVVYGAQR